MRSTIRSKKWFTVYGTGTKIYVRILEVRNQASEELRDNVQTFFLRLTWRQSKKSNSDETSIKNPVYKIIQSPKPSTHSDSYTCFYSRPLPVPIVVDDISKNIQVMISWYQEKSQRNLSNVLCYLKDSQRLKGLCVKFQ